ncbi:MAG: hypothetical protein V3S39_11300 [Thermodesulfobacteriota bacterium]
MKKIGYYGHPPLSVIEHFRRILGQELLDLDVDFGSPDTKVVPEAYCQIITNIIDNAIFFRPQLSLIIASVGEEKCDGGRFAAAILKDLGFKVVETRNTRVRKARPINIAKSVLPVVEKVLKIMDTVHTPDREQYPECEPSLGFWGVPPHDLTLLELFPDSTHIYGWTRCVEAGRPADIRLETYVDPGVPTVFYTQAFCPKQQLAKYLAEKYGGMCVDADGQITQSTIAKVEAFIKLV